MMMTGWESFIYFASAALVLWLCGALAAWKDRYRTAIAMTAGGLLVYAVFIVLFWAGLQRPPMPRAETNLYAYAEAQRDCKQKFKMY